MSSSALIRGEAVSHLAGTAVDGAVATLLTTLAEVEAVGAEWRGLYERSPCRNPFLSPEWNTACLRSVAEGDRPYVLTLRLEGVLSGVAPLRLERTAGFRVLRQAGSGWSPYGGFLRREDRPDVDARLLEALAARKNEWDLLILTQLAEPFTALEHCATPAGTMGGVSPTPWPGSACLARDVDWDTLLREGPGWLKSSAKAARRFEREGGVAVRVTGLEASGRLAEIEAIESASWQGRHGHSASLRTRDRVMRLLSESLRTLGESGEAELWLAHVGDRPAAYAVNLLLPGRLWMYRGAYDPEHARLRLGSVLDHLAIRQAWQDGRREYDYMSGGETYKLERTDGLRDLKQLVLAARTPRGMLASGCLRAPQQVLDRAPAGRRLIRSAARLARSPRSFFADRKAAGRVH